MAGDNIVHMTLVLEKCQKSSKEVSKIKELMDMKIDTQISRLAVLFQIVLNA